MIFHCPDCAAHAADGGTASVPIAGKGSHLRSKFHQAAAFIEGQRRAGRSVASSVTRSILRDLDIAMVHGPTLVSKRASGKVDVIYSYWADADLNLVSRLGFFAGVERPARMALVKAFHADASPERRAAAAAVIKLADVQRPFLRDPESVTRAEDAFNRVVEMLR